jgi:hypothetical protein
MCDILFLNEIKHHLHFACPQSNGICLFTLNSVEGIVVLFLCLLDDVAASGGGLLFRTQGSGKHPKINLNFGILIVLDELPQNDRVTMDTTQQLTTLSVQLLRRSMRIRVVKLRL